METLSLPQRVARIDQELLRSYRSHLDFYNGLQWNGSARRGERRLTFNYAKVLLEKVTSYLMAGASFAIEPVESGDEARRRVMETLGVTDPDGEMEEIRRES